MWYNDLMSSFDPSLLDTMNADQALDFLQKEAIARGISDIHMSPEKTEIRLEWRELGILKRIGSVTPQVFDGIRRRIKFIAKLKLNIENIPQDGQYTFPFDERTINVRVATLPSRFGEVYTLRFLDPKKGIVPLQQLGFPRTIHEELQQLMEIPNGLILVTGPTGSGKTTTLYALLSEVAGKEKNIITLEDPIEYELEHSIQSQVDPEHGLTFASGLRSILRHDPDIILVGEIRDQETAQTAIDAALTGHLVLATLHTNSALEAIPRLLSMGVSSYTFAPALRAILAQRLVRTVNTDAVKNNSSPLDPSLFIGQIALPELLIATPEIRSLIMNQATEQEIQELAIKQGYATMKTWGERYIAEGKTIRSEIERVTAE
jgi:general secretion pathway protein E